MKRKISVVLAAVLSLNVNFVVKASGEISPELIAYEDFKYEDYVGSDITTIPGAMNADPDKGFSSGYKKTSSGTAVTAASHRIEQDENGDYYVKALKYSPDKLYRMFEEDSVISIKPQTDGTSLYYITWEQYLGENVVLAGSGNIGDNDGQRIEFAENNIMMGFKKNTSDEAIPFIRWGRTEEGQAWGERAMHRGKTYKMVMKLVPSAAEKDVLTLKAYPKAEYPLEDWDVGIAIAGSTPWSHVGFATGALVSGGDNDQRFANLKIEHFNTEEAVSAIEDAEEKTIAAVEAIKAGQDAEELITLANESLDSISDCEAKNVISSMLDGALVYSDIYRNLSELAVNYSDELMAETRLLVDAADGVFIKAELEKSLNEIDAMLEVGVLVEKAEETKSDEDIQAAFDAVNNLPSGSLKQSYEDRLNAIVAEKEAVSSVETAESEVSKESFDAAMELVEALPDGEVKNELTARLEAIRKVIAENYAEVMVDKAELEKTKQSLENAMNWVSALDEGDLKDELLARLELLSQSISLVYIRDVFDYPSGTLVNSVEKLMSADEENGFSTGWTTKSDLTGKPGNNVSFDGKGLMLINGVNNIEAYRGLSNKINFAEDGEYYVSWKQYVYPEAKNGTNQSQRFKFSVKGEAEPRFKIGFIGNGVNGFNMFVKDTSGIVQYDKEYPSDVVYNFKMRISTTAEGMDKISVKIFAEGENEPSDWQIVRTASSDYCIDMLGFRSNFNPAGNHGLGSILVEKYTSDVLSAFSNAEAAVKAAVTEGTQSALANAEAQLSKMCDCLAKEDLRSKISELAEKFEIIAECNEILSEIESVQITESNATEISDKLDYIKEKLMQLPEDISSGIKSRCNAIENKLNTVLISAERVVDKFDGNNWFGNEALDTPVDGSAEKTEMYRSYTFDMTDSTYYARLTFTPTSSDAEFKVGDAKVSVSGLNANEENTVIVEADKNGVSVYTKDGKKLGSVQKSITEATTLGLISANGTVFAELELEKVNSDYLSLVADAMELKENGSLSEIAAAEAAVDAFAPSIVKDMLESKIVVATEENKKQIPELTVAKIDGLGVVGETVKAVAEVSDNGGNFKEYKYEWTCGSKLLSDTDTYKVEHAYASKIITLTITPYSIYGVAGKAVSDTIKIKAQTSGGTGGGGGGGGGGGKTASGGAAALGNAATSVTTKPTVEKETANAEKVSEFVDINSHWAKEDIEYMASKGIVSGVNNNFFVPDNNITRAEFATLLCRLCGLDTKATDDFADVAADAWYNGYIGAVVDSGIMSGSDSGFKPDAFITRQEMAKGIVNSYVYLGKSMEEKEDSEFSDYASISDWAKEYVNKCASIGIMVGDSDGAFRPLANATRAEATVVIKRVFISK